MSVRRSLAVLVVAAIVGTSTLVASGASARAPAPWSPPTRIPGTVGLVKPVPAVAPDGTDLVTRLVAGSGTFSNAVVGKVRLPGQTKWKPVPKGPEGSFLGVSGIEGTASGDFWIAADGRLMVTAYSPPKVDPPGDPLARIAVGIRSPGGTWTDRFLSPADEFASGQRIAVNPAGDVRRPGAHLVSGDGI